ncbi:MAG: tRNA lysidine(34) synthetase TilS [Bacteroidota bacterium]
MLGRFKHHIALTFPFLGKSRLLIACSGGVDSMVLAYLVKESGYDFALAHCNYKLRGQASDLDEALVRKWSLENDKQCFVKTFDLKDKEGSIQLKARNLRYDWFKELTTKERFDYVLTAHHADDNLETFFINLSRGTGLDGLRGIPQSNQDIVRPLLPFTKEDILKYAKSVGVPWREDKTNAELQYLRNRIRHEIVPKLREINPSFLFNFLQTQHYLGHGSQLLTNYGDELRAKLFAQSEARFYIPIDELKKLQPLEGYIFLLFKPFGFTQWQDLEDLLEGQSGKEIRSRSHRMIKNRAHLILAPLTLPSLLEYEFHENENESEWNDPIHLRIERVDAKESNSINVIYVDKEKLNYPLKLRKWKIGDYFYPLGMKGRKKLSKFFKDEKYSTIQKEEQWLLCSTTDIVWVLGKRMDDRFKVDQQTKETLKISWLL